MRYQQLGETDLNVSEAGFGVWTVATNWWGKIEPSDHRSHRRQLWLNEGLKRLDHLDYLTESLSLTIGQIAIKFCLAAPKIVSVLPNITNMKQLQEFVAAPESEDIPQDLLDRAFELQDENFYPEPVEEASSVE